jgi:hypothetical protein
MTTGDERLAGLLRQTRVQNLERAVESLERSGLPHYASSATPENRQRLAALYDVAVECVARRNLGAMHHHARTVAQERFRSGFGLLEVHTAFNVLEEVVWRAVTERMDPEDYPEAFGLVSTVLGAGKQTLAIEYVALADPRARFQTLDLTELFKGTT